MAIQKKGEKLRCPHCHFEMDDSENLVEDYVIPGRVGFASRGEDEQCPECDGWFSVEHIGDDQYDVQEVEDHEED